MTKELWRRRCESLRHMIGDTPLLALRCRFRGEERTVYAKHEILNLTGSIKDRMVLHVLERAHASGALGAGDTLVEATSGNTGIALAAVGRALGHPVRIYMPDWMSRERVQLLESLGAEIVLVSHDEGGFVGSVAKAAEFARANPATFVTRQFENEDNVLAHAETTGRELLEQLARRGLEPTAFVAGVGTGGTVMGVGRLLRERVPGASVHPLEPANSPTLATGHQVGEHRIQGISDEFVPAIVRLDELDRIVDVWDGDAILMAQRLARELGLAVGISSGANLLGALEIALEQGPDSVVCTVFADSNKKYLSTDLCRVEPVEERYASPHVRLLGCEVVPRASLGTPAATR